MFNGITRVGRPHHSVTFRAVALAVGLLVALAGVDLSADRRRSGGSVRQSSNVNRNGGASRSNNYNRNVNRNANVNRNTNVNVNRNVDIDNDCCGGGWGDNYHPVARGAAVAATTAVVMGSYYNSLPGNCVTVVRVGVNYSQCGSTWYQPVYSGSNVQYVVVQAP